MTKIRNIIAATKNDLQEEVDSWVNLYCEQQGFQVKKINNVSIIQSSYKQSSGELFVNYYTQTIVFEK